MEYTRGMANYLLRNGLIVGNKRSELLVELGDTRISGQHTWKYSPLYADGDYWGIDPVYIEDLVIHFDARDIATEAYIYVWRQGQGRE